jgi:hypothetical protein
MTVLMHGWSPSGGRSVRHAQAEKSERSAKFADRLA